MMTFLNDAFFSGGFALSRKERFYYSLGPLKLCRALGLGKLAKKLPGCEEYLIFSVSFLSDLY